MERTLTTCYHWKNGSQLLVEVNFLDLDPPVITSAVIKSPDPPFRPLRYIGARALYQLQMYQDLERVVEDYLQLCNEDWYDYEDDCGAAPCPYDRATPQLPKAMMVCGKDKTNN